MSATPIDTLPLPNVIETLDYETILAERVDDLKARFLAKGIDWDVDTLETDPIMIALEASAYRETVMRARINDAARANLLAFARLADLEHLAAFYDVTRLAGESDSRLLLRTQLTIIGRSPGGTIERYKAIVMGVSIRVRDVEVWRTATDPTVRVSVLTNEGDGEADAALLAEVDAALLNPSHGVTSDRFAITSAVKTTVDVALEVRLEANSSKSILTDLPDLIAADWTAESLLGLDLTKSWLIAHAMRAGVTRVDVMSPDEDVEVDKSEAIAIGTITIIDGGRGR